VGGRQPGRQGFNVRAGSRKAFWYDTQCHDSPPETVMNMIFINICSTPGRDRKLDGPTPIPPIKGSVG
jgi:hypothetical protein